MLVNGYFCIWMIGNIIVIIIILGIYIGQDGNCDNCLVLRKRIVNVLLKESVKIERNVKQKIIVVDVMIEDFYIQFFDEKGYGMFMSYGIGIQIFVGVDEFLKFEVKLEFYSGVLLDWWFSGQFVVINL